MDRRSLGGLLVVAGAAVILSAIFVVRPDDGRPAVAAPAVDSATGTSSTAGTPAASTTSVAEQHAQDFLEGFFGALVANDAVTLYDTLHPVVIERCGEEELRSYLQTLDDDTADFTLLAVSDLEAFDFDPGNGTTVVVEDTRAVMIDRVIQGETVEQTIHLGVLDNRLRWFTRCPS